MLAVAHTHTQSTSTSTSAIITRFPYNHRQKQNPMHTHKMRDTHAQPSELETEGAIRRLLFVFFLCCLTRLFEAIKTKEIR